MDKQEVVISDIRIRISLWSMVVFMVKFAIAAIPAFVIWLVFQNFFAFVVGL